MQERIDAQQPTQAGGEVAVAASQIQHVQIALPHHRPGFQCHPAPPAGAQQRHEIGVTKLRVTAEDLIAALAVEQDFHACVACGAHHAPLRIKAEREKRHVLVPRHALEHVPEVVGVGKDEVGRGAHRMSGRERILPLVELRILPARCEREEAITHSGRGFRLVAPNLPDERYDRRGIDSTAQATARADVADQVRSRGVQ